MPYTPKFTISPRLLTLVEMIAALRERILGAAVELSWIPALQKDTRTRNGHASTAIEGNPLTLEQVRALEEGRELAASDLRSSREVLNYFAGLRRIEREGVLGIRGPVNQGRGFAMPGVRLRQPFAVCLTPPPRQRFRRPN
jgi:Fic family protein